jgi:hypothetical protein
MGGFCERGHGNMFDYQIRCHQAGTRQRFRSGKAKVILQRIFGAKKHKTTTERSANFRALLRTILFVADGMQEELREGLISRLETVVCDTLMKWDNGFSNALMCQETNLTCWENLVASWLLAARSQRLFMTSGALFGLASKALLPGDDIWILHHCPKPMCQDLQAAHKNMRLD